MSRRTTKKVTKQRGRERDGGDQIRERKGKIKKTRKEREKKERDIKHNEKDTFTLLLMVKRERWVMNV